MRAALDSQNPKSALTELILARAAQSRVYGVLDLGILGFEIWGAEISHVRVVLGRGLGSSQRILGSLEWSLGFRRVGRGFCAVLPPTIIQG